MRVGSVGEETLVFNLVHGISAVGEKLVFDTVELVADNDCFEFYTKFVGENAAFGEKFKTYIGHVAFVVFAVNDEIVLICHNVYEVLGA